MRNILLIFLLMVGLTACKKKVAEDPNVFYTCSMDPQVMEKKPGSCPICKMPLTRTVINPKKSGTVNSLNLSDLQIKLANIKTIKIGSSLIGEGITIRGTVATDETKNELISARVNGRIDKFYFKNEGDKINIGDRVYEIYSEELQASINQYLLLKDKATQFKGGPIDYSQMLNSARDKLFIWGMTQNQIEKLNSDKVNSLIPFFSKVSGVVTKVLVSEGIYVNEGSPIIEVSDYSSVWVLAEAYPKDAKFIKRGSKVRVVIEAYPNEEIEGQIAFENPELQPQSKVNLVRINIPNTKGRYKPGMRSSITISTSKNNSLNIPEEAVLYQPSMNTVWTKNEQGGFAPKMVEVGTRSNGNIEIISGLKEGEEVVISGVYLIDSEFKLRKGSPSENMPGMNHSNPESGNDAAPIHNH